MKKTSNWVLRANTGLRFMDLDGGVTTWLGHRLTDSRNFRNVENHESEINLEENVVDNKNEWNLLHKTIRIMPAVIHMAPSNDTILEKWYFYHSISYIIMNNYFIVYMLYYSVNQIYHLLSETCFVSRWTLSVVSSCLISQFLIDQVMVLKH